MEINKDEAIRFLAIAKNHYESGNCAAAIRFATKSISLCPSEAARSFLEKAQEASAYSSSSTSSAPPPKHPLVTPKLNPQPQPQQLLFNSSEQKYTYDQIEAVKHIIECGANYYKVLSLEKNCTDVQIKKSYRKLALQFHPDKNSAPGADEAFKLISKAFVVLSDPQKRIIHDADGGDPEQRGSSAPWSFETHCEEDISPEDLFNMFFGPTATTTANGSVFSSATFVSPGFAPHTYYRSNSGGAGNPASSNQHHQEWAPSSAFKAPTMSSRSPGTMTILLQILPLVILFGYSLLSSLFTKYSTTTSSSLVFSLKPTPLCSQARVTQSQQVPYYVNPSAFRSMEGNQYRLSRVEQQVETDWMRSLQQACQNERRERASRINAVSGTVFGIGRDEEQYQAALKMPLKSCEQASQFGYNINPYRR